MAEEFFDDDENREMIIPIGEGGVVLELGDYITSFWVLPENVDSFYEEYWNAPKRPPRL